MAALRVRVECAQCGREAPDDPVELALWRHGELALQGGELDDITAAMVLCPDCDAESRQGEYESGEPG